MNQAEKNAHELLALVPDVMKLGRRDPVRRKFVERLKKACRDIRRGKQTATGKQTVRRVVF